MSRSISLAILVAIAGSCARTVRAWPPPLTPGTSVHVHFTVPRVVAFEHGSAKDSAGAVRDLRGTVSALKADTLSLIVQSVASTNAGESSMLGHRATLALDPSTIVTFSEIDSWKFAYALLSGVVLIFAALVMSGS